MLFRKQIENAIKETSQWKKFENLNEEYKGILESTVPYSKNLNCKSIKEFNSIEISDYMKDCLHNPNNAIHSFIKIAVSHQQSWEEYVGKINQLLAADVVFSKNKKLNEKYKDVFYYLVHLEALSKPETNFTIQKSYYSCMLSKQAFDCRIYSLDNILEMLNTL